MIYKFFYLFFLNISLCELINSSDVSTVTYSPHLPKSPKSSKLSKSSKLPKSTLFPKTGKVSQNILSTTTIFNGTLIMSV